MNQLLPLLIAVVLAAVVFFMTEAGPVEACGRAVVTFVVVLFIGAVVTRSGRKKDA